MRPPSPVPHRFSIELLRLDEVEAAHGARAGQAEDYAMRRDKAVYQDATLRWDQRTLTALEAVQQVPADPEALAFLSQRLNRFVQEAAGADLATALADARAAGAPLHIEVVSAAAELYALPWEQVELADGPIGAHPDVLLRYELPAAPNPPPHPHCRTPGGRVLVAWATAPQVGGQVPAAHHVAAITQALDAGHLDPEAGLTVLDSMSPGSLAGALEAARNEGRPFRVLHLLAHGVPTQQGGAPGFALVLAPEGEALDASLLHADQLEALLRPHADTLRLVVLAACSGADPAGLGAQGGSLAQAVRRAGVPAVLASRYPLRVPASTLLTQVLYRALLVDLCSLEQATVGARQALRSAPDAGPLDGCTLQLYGRPTLTGDQRPFVFAPYRGLFAYRARHARFLFGREPEIASLANRVRRTRTDPDAPRFILLTGASGTGKSSLVQAGLLPTLAHGPEDWGTGLLRPANHRPAQAVLGALTHTGPTIVILDQLEELFTQLDPPRAHAWINAVWAAIHRPDGPVAIGTIRLDFLHRLGQLRVGRPAIPLDRALALQGGTSASTQYLLALSSMGPQEVLDIVQKPAARVGLRFEPGLVERLVADLGEEEGRLPLLAHALHQLWLRRDEGHLTDRAYDEIGGVAGALAKTAESWWASLDQDRATRRAAEGLLLRLVDLDPEQQRRTRRRVWLDLARPADPVAGSRHDHILARMVDARLVVVGGADPAGEHPRGWVELVHEALLRSWPRLRQLIERQGHHLALIQELEDGARTWEADCAEGGRWRARSQLLQGHELSEALALRAHQGDRLGAGLLRFLRHSEANSIRRRRFKQAMGAALALTMMVGTVVAAGLGIQSRAWAERANDRLLLRFAQGMLTEDPTLALAALDEVQDPGAEPEWLGLARDALTARVAVLSVNEVVGFAWAPPARSETQDRLITVNRGGSISAWAPAEGRRLATRKQFPSEVASVAKGLEDQIDDTRVLGPVVSPDGERIASATTWQVVLNRSHGSKQRRVELSPPLRGRLLEDTPIAWSPDAQRVMVATETGDLAIIHRRPAQGPPPPTQRLETGRTVAKAWFGPNGKTVFTLGAKGTVEAWSLDGGGGRVVAWAPPDADGQAQLWPLQGGAKVVLQNPSGAWMLALQADGRFGPGTQLPGVVHIQDLDQTPDGRLLGVGHFLGLNVFDVSGAVPQPSAYPATPGGPFYQIALSPQGGQLVAAASQYAATMTPQSSRIWTFDRIPTPKQVALSADGTHLGLLSGEGELRLIDQSGESQVLRARSAVERFSFSPDGQHIAALTHARDVRVWPVVRPQTKGLATATVQAQGVQQALFSADGQTLATLSPAGSVKVHALHPLGAQELISVPEDPFFTAIQLSRDGRTLLIEAGPTLHIYASKAGAPSRFGQEQRVSNWDPARRPLLLPDGTGALVPSARGGWSAVDFRLETNDPNTEPEPLHDLAIDPSGRWMVGRMTDGITRVDLHSPSQREPMAHRVPELRVAESGGIWAASGALRSLRWLPPPGVEDLGLRPELSRWVPMSTRYAWNTLDASQRDRHHLILTALRLVGYRPITALALAPGGQSILAGGVDGVVAQVDQGGGAQRLAEARGIVRGVDLQTTDEGSTLLVQTVPPHPRLLEALDIEQGAFRIDDLPQETQPEIFDPLSGDPLGVFPSGPGAALLDGGRRLATVEADGKLTLWPLPFSAVHEALGARSRTCLTTATRQSALRQGRKAAERGSTACQQRQRTRHPDQPEAK